MANPFFSPAAKAALWRSSLIRSRIGANVPPAVTTKIPARPAPVIAKPTPAPVAAPPMLTIMPVGPGTMIGSGALPPKPTYSKPGWEWIWNGSKWIAVPPMTISLPEKISLPTASPPPVAQSSTEAILSASSGGEVMPTVAPPSPEASVVEMATAKKPAAGGGGAMLAGAGAGFLVAGPIGAVAGAIIAGAMSKPKPTPVAGFDGFSFKKITRKVKKAVGKGTGAVFRTAGAIVMPATLVSSVASATGLAYVGKKIGIKKAGKLHAALKGELKRDIVLASASVATGAAIAAGVVAAPYVTAAGVATAAKFAAPLLSSSASPGELESIESALATQAAESAAEKGPPAGPSGIVPVLAGAGAGFLVLGPIGAVVGGIVGGLVGRKG